MRHRVEIRLMSAGAVVGLAAVSGVWLSPAAADDRPGTWSSFTEASGVRVSLVRPAALPTADEIAGLSVPFARAETDSSPIGRAVGSWLWPGEWVADAKSLLLLGLDPSAAGAEIQQRKRKRPGTDGCYSERVLGTPEVRNPDGQVVVPAQTLINPLTNGPIEDPTDNPCGEYAVRVALQTLVRRRVPDYPFWSRSVWPAPRPQDASDGRTLCEAPSSFPPDWQIPREAERPCPPGLQARGGLTEARSSHTGDWGTARLAELSLPSLVRATSVTALASTEWQGGTLVSSGSVTFNDLVILGAGGAELVNIEVLRSSLAAFSDGRPSEAGLEASGVTVTIGGTRYPARIDRGGIEIAGASLPPEARDRLTEALGRAMLDARGPRLSFGGVSTGGGARATGPAARSAGPAGEPAGVTAFSIETDAEDSIHGPTTLRLSFGTVTAAALARAAPPMSFPPGGSPPAGPRAVFIPGVPGTIGVPGVPGTEAAPRAFGLPGVRVERSVAFGHPASEPVPAGVVLGALVVAAALAAALVAAGIWETLF